MVSGTETLDSIEQSIADIRRQEQSLLEELERANAEHVNLLDQRTAAFRELAEVRTRHAVADGVIDRADQLQHRVENVLRARQKTIEALKARNAQAEDRRRQHNVAAAAVRVEIVDLERQLDEVGQEAKRQLASEPRYIELVKAQKETAATFEKADEKAKRAEDDYARKGKAYESDPLFMYLWNRKYRSSEYRPSSLIRMSDDFVARLVGYNEARANYAILEEIPVRLRKHCDRLADRADETRKRVEAAEAERMTALAGTDLPALTKEARRRQGQIRIDLERVEAEIDEVSGQLNQYGEGLDEQFKQAVELATGFLEQENYRRLMSLARQTVEPTDDHVVDRIGEIDRRVTELKRAIEGRRADLDNVARRRKELMDVAASFRRNDYEDPGSVFMPDDVVGDLLSELLRGAISGADYWQRSRRRHGWDDRPADPFRRGSGMPPFGGGWGSGDDDFRTGGGF